MVLMEPTASIEKHTQVEKTSTPVDHRKFDTILLTHVNPEGRVDYAGLKRNLSELDAYLNILKRGFHEKATDNEKLAFWINAYNAFTLKMIIDHYPVNSIRTLYNGKPWEHAWIPIKGKMYSLDDIEHGIIRKQFREPRIHFAVNCASLSCPPLQNRAYTAKNIDTLLEKATKEFINSRENSIQVNSVELSSIFKWYAEDFGNIIAFVNRYSTVKVDNTAQISYKEYDWNLNDVPPK
jgi:hypothetical protein